MATGKSTSGRGILTPAIHAGVLQMSDSWIPPNPKYPPPKQGEPPLHRAARIGDHASIRSLMAGGADAAAMFDIGLDPSACAFPATALMVAAGSGDGANAETVRLLIELGADPKCCAGGGSAADFACSGLGWNYRPGGDAPRLRLLLKAGSPLTLSGERGARLTGVVARAGDAERLRILLDYGASPNGWDNLEERVADWHRLSKAMMSQEGPPIGASGVPKDLFVGSLDGIAPVGPAGEARGGPYSFLIPLFRAVKGDNIECVRMLLDAGADPRQRDAPNRTAVWEVQSDAVLRLLLAAGLTLEERDTYGWTPVMDAVHAQDGIDAALARVRALIACGANVNASKDRGYTVFMCAVGSGRHPLMLQTLIDAGADPHAVSELGYNAFHAAIDVDGENETVETTFKFLHRVGVSLEHRNRAGHTPLSRAIWEGDATDVRVLVDLGADPDSSAPLYCFAGERCAPTDVPLVFHAIKSCHPDVNLEALLRAGVRLDVVDAEGRTPLEFARYQKQAVEGWSDSSLTKPGRLEEADRCIQLLTDDESRSTRGCT